MKDSMSPHIAALHYFSSACVGCRICDRECALLDSFETTPAQLAALALGHEELPEETVGLVQQCSLCGLCGTNCPAGLNPADLMQALRESLVKAQRIEIGSYLPMLVDRQHHFFSLYRSTWHIDYSDLLKQDCSVLFFPGCSLAGFAPELTRSVYHWLAEEHGSDIGFSDSCCGLPLANIGLGERCKNHANALAGEFARTGVRQIVSACPNCFYHLQGKFPGIEVVSLYQLLAEADIKVPEGLTTTIHDSCPDRYTGAIAESMRAILAPTRIVEMEHSRSRTICCGAGGIVSMVAPEVSRERAERRIGEICRTRADVCISTCMACVKRLHVDSDDAPEVVHLLEVVFDQKIDHRELQYRLEQMWQGERGDRNLELLNGACGHDVDTTAGMSRDV